MKKNIVHTFLILASLFIISCSSTNTQIADGPMEKPLVESAVPIRYDIYIKNFDGSAVSNTQITMKSRTFIDTGVTNSEGLVSLVGERSGSEPLQFTFENKNLRANEILGHLPTSLTSGTLSFEIINENRVRLSHYIAEGLHR